MDEKEKTKELIKQVWRVQYRTVGEASVNKLYEAVQQKKPIDDFLSSAQGGSSFDLHSIWNLLYEAVDLTANALALYTLWKQKNNNTPSKKEMAQLLREARVENLYSRAVLERLDILIDKIIEKEDD